MSSQLKDRIDELMAAKGWGVTDVARAAGVSRSAVSQWRGAGSKQIFSIGRIDVAERLAAASGFSALWLARGEGPKFAVSSMGSAPARPAADDGWPFLMVSRDAIGELDAQQLTRLEGALLLAMGQLGVSNKQTPPRGAEPTGKPGRPGTYEEVEDPFWSPPPEPMPWEPGARTVRSEALAQEKKLRISRASDVSANADAGYSANDHEFMAVPELGVRLAAGKLGIENYEETKIGEIQFRRSFLESFGLPIERMSIVYADGDSMMPIIRPRGPMLFYQEEITSRHQLDPYTVYAINHGGRMIVKCIGRSREGTWLAKSINPHHTPFPLDGEDGCEVRIVGRILWSPYDLRAGVDARLLQR